MDWRDAAHCREADPDLFFPIGDSRPAVRQLERAQAICRDCPVRGACLEWALRTGQGDGVWGGRSERDRRGIRRPPSPAARLPIPV